MKDEITDNELLDAFHAGDGAAFTELLSRYTEKAYNLAYRLTRSKEDSEEVIQDVFVTVYLKSQSFERKSAFSSWLYRITVNTSYMKLRKNKQTQAVSFEDLSPGVRDSWIGKDSASSDINYLTARHQLRDRLEEAIKSLPDDYRMIFILRDVDGLSSKEVSEVMGLSVAAVKSRLHRSRLMLRKRLDKFYRDYQSPDRIYYGPKGTGFLEYCDQIH